MNELIPALIEWAKWVRMTAVAQSRGVVTAPPGSDPRDWRAHLPVRTLAVFSAMQAAGIWDPDDAE